MMSPEERAAAMQMLGQGAAQNAGQLVNPMNRQAQLQAQEAAAMGEAPPQASPPQTMMGGPVERPPIATKDPSILKRLADLLRGASK
jgi:hypothetical protein